MTRIEIAPAAQALFPGLGAALVEAHDLDAARIGESLQAARAAARTAMAPYGDLEAVNAAEIILEWKEAFKTMGLRPAEYRSSLEGLMRMWTKGREPESGMQLVDLYNLVSIASAAPVGAIDLDRFPAGEAMSLRAADPTLDSFQPVSGEVKLKTGANAISYCVGAEIVCYALNHRDSANFGLTAETKRAAFVAEWTNPRQAARARIALEEIARLLTQSGAQVSPLQSFGAS